MRDRSMTRWWPRLPRRSLVPLVALVTLVTLCLGLTGGCMKESPMPERQDPLPLFVTGDPAQGWQVYHRAELGCKFCHYIGEEGTPTGPELTAIASVLEERVGSPENVASFLRESLLDPDAYVDDAYPPGLMSGYGEVLTPREVDDLVAYLWHLRGPEPSPHEAAGGTAP